MVEGEVSRGLGRPRGGIVGHAAVRPRLKRTNERLLHHVLRELQPMRAELPGEHRHQPGALAPEEIGGDFSCAGIGLGYGGGHLRFL